MNTNVNLEAALGVLGFLGACALMFIVVIVAAHSLLTRRGRRLKFSLAAAAGVMTLYLGLMFAFSLVSTEKRLARGEEKHFCEIDCHLAYAVTDLIKTKTIGEGANQARAAGVFYLVTVRTRFDEQTIGKGRGDAPLTPNSRALTVWDAKGQSYGPSSEGARALELSGAAGTPIWSSLRPGESYNTTFAFDLPEAVERPVLLMSDDELVSTFVIGHENSPLHKKVLFSLDEPRRPVANVGLRRRLSWQIKGIAVALLRRLKGYDRH